MLLAMMNGEALVRMHVTVAEGARRHALTPLSARRITLWLMEPSNGLEGVLKITLDSSPVALP
jgi:hypothetical protein